MTGLPITAREARLRVRPGPAGMAAGVFDIVDTVVQEPGEGEVLVRNLAMSVEPYMRLCLDDTYGPAMASPLGEPPSGSAVGRVVLSRASGLVPGDIVRSNFGWRECFLVSADAVEKLPVIANIPAEAFLSVLGTTGFTAYVGMIDIGRPSLGETVLVSGAAGAVGSVACQLAKARGATVIGIAGSEDKCSWLKKLGIDHVINYRQSPDLVHSIGSCAPDGIDLYFDNVGGSQLEAAITVARPRARFVECGMISTYQASEAPKAPHNLVQIIAKGLTLYGYTAADFGHLQPAFRAAMLNWLATGEVQWRHNVYDNLARAPQALDDLFAGVGIGKSIVRLADE